MTDILLYLGLLLTMKLVNGSYTIQGVNVLDICREFGTPVYVYDAEKIQSQYNTLKGAFSETRVKIKYAAKALTNVSILKLLKNLGSGVDVVSLNEAQLALGAGFDPKDIMFTPSGVSFDEIEQAVEMGISINLDNLSSLKKFGQKYGGRVPLGVRLNPHIMAGGNYKISTGHSNSKFGISIYQLPEILEVVKAHDMKIIGLHIHTGSEITETEVFLKMSEILFSVARDFRDLRFLDFGSGFKVAYKEGDLVTNIYDVGLNLSKRFNAFCEEYGRHIELWIEPGKFIVSEAGYLFVEATVIKSSPSVTFVGVNSGLNHLIRPMMYDAYHQIINVSNPAGSGKLYTVVGYICETDTFGADRKLNEVSEGDVLAICNAGAYSYTMSSNYNSRPRPPEVLIVNGQARLIRRRENLDDLLRGQIDIGL
jgi:diaminopimelate decarboxylase